MSARLPIWVSNTILLCFLTSLGIYFFVHREFVRVQDEMNHLENLGNLSFAVVQEIGRVKNKFPIQYECHYSFSLKNGQLAESSEVIPYTIYRKLKLGDSIQIYRKEMMVFGRKIAVSKIKENDEVSTPLIHLERFFRGAVAYFAVLIGLATLFRAWGLQFRTYRSP